jgi:hypothetical protein
MIRPIFCRQAASLFKLHPCLFFYNVLPVVIDAFPEALELARHFGVHAGLQHAVGQVLQESNELSTDSLLVPQAVHFRQNLALFFSDRN